MFGKRTKKSDSMNGIETAPGLTVKRIANNTWSYYRPDGALVIRLHYTDIAVKKADSSVTMHVGEYRTPTTKDRLNEFACPKGWHIYQDKGEWYLRKYSDEPGGYWGFQDGITIHANGTVTGAAPESAISERKKLVKRIHAYAKGYVDALIAGDVGLPGPGDCFCCHMVDAKTGKPMKGTDHLLSHMEENYYVPSLVVNAWTEFPICPLAAETAIGLMKGNNAEYGKEFLVSIMRRDVTRSIVRYMKRQFSIAA